MNRFIKIITLFFLLPIVSSAYSIVDSSFCGEAPGLNNCIDTSTHTFLYSCIYTVNDEGGKLYPSQCLTNADSYPDNYTTAYNFAASWGAGVPNTGRIFGSNSEVDFCTGEIQTCLSYSTVMCLSVGDAPDYIASIAPCISSSQYTAFNLDLGDNSTNFAGAFSSAVSYSVQTLWQILLLFGAFPLVFYIMTKIRNFIMEMK
jgi:hypothetical protein